jgi:carboxyl-terminal processing protease
MIELKNSGNTKRRTKAIRLWGTACCVWVVLAQTAPAQVIAPCRPGNPAPCPTRLAQNLQAQNAKGLIDETWQIVNRSYIDESFNGQDWPSVRTKYLNGTYASQAEAYVAIKKMLEPLGDRFTRFLPPETYAAMHQGGESGNIGLPLSRNQLVLGLGNLDSPASKAGLLPGDMLVSIDNRLVLDMTDLEVRALLPGREGTAVQLKVKRGLQELEFKVERSTKPLPTIYSSSQKTAAGQVAYIRLHGFPSDATRLMESEIRNWEDRSVAGYILDLRANSGGLLQAGIDIAYMWVPRETVLLTMNSRSGKEDISSSQSTLTQKPLVIIVDQQSAAASEILASALQGNRRAILVGTATYGSNSIQSVHSLMTDGGGIAVTIAKWRTVSGKDISKTGVVPDVVVDLTLTQQQNLVRKRQLGTLADPQYEKALQSLIRQIQTSK